MCQSCVCLLKCRVASRFAVCLGVVCADILLVWSLRYPEPTSTVHASEISRHDVKEGIAQIGFAMAMRSGLNLLSFSRLCRRKRQGPSRGHESHVVQHSRHT